MVALPPDVPHSVDPLDRLAAGRDLWPRDTLAVRDHTDIPVPEAVFWPESDDQVVEVLRAAASAGRVVVPWGAGSGVAGGARGRPDGWTLDLKRFDGIGEVDPETWSVEVGAGVTGQRLEDALAAAGWAMGHSPSSIGCSTVGGWVAARGAGQFSSAYGVFEDMVLGLDAVLPAEGAVHAGLPGLSSRGRRLTETELDALIGSEGTLGVVTRVRMRVRPLPALRSMRGWRFPDVPTAVEAMRELMQGETWPVALRLYDPIDTWIGGKTKPKKERPAGHRAWHRSLLASLEARAPDVVRHELALPLSMPRVLQRVAGTAASGCLLIVGWEGSREVVRTMEAAARPILARHGRDLGPGPGERWYASRHAVSYKLMPIVLRGGFVDTMEVAAPWSAIPGLWRRVQAAVSPHALVMAHFSHAYPEGGSIYFSFAGRGDVSVYDAAWRAATRAVLEAGASVSHHHGIGRLKRQAATEALGPMLGPWRQLRARLDPEAVLNPGVLVEDRPRPTASTPAATPGHRDGLARIAPGESLSEHPEDVRWRWDRASGPPRWARNAWECGWVGVSGTLDGQTAHLGRGPREAVGPDLRRVLWAEGEHVEATVGVARDVARWMGAAPVSAPWSAVRDLLRAGLRPGSVGVVDGRLHIGFRGPAAADLGELAAEVLGVDLTPVPWQPLVRYAGAMVSCADDDPRAVAATEQGVWRPQEGGDA